MNAAVGISRGPRMGVLLTALLAATGSWAQNAPDKTPAPSGTAPAHAAKPATAAGDTADVKAPASSKAQTSYSIGVSMGAQLRSFGVTPDSLAMERLTQGFRDALGGKVTPTPQDQQAIQAFIKSARENLAENNRAAAQTFLAENGKKKDVVTTASGLEYRVIKPGDGESPKATDEVTVNYRGTLLDGTEFDSSYKRGQPVSFPVNGVIPGWQEALVLMKPGAKWELFVPPKLAYDMNSPTPTIPPASLLRFEVELIGIKPPAPVPAPRAAPTPH
jgi:FKBP-type peptidyl-prolyl cis-trans isomerase FklB